MLTQETEGRGRPKALCYKNILLIVMHHPKTSKDVLAIAVSSSTTKAQKTSLNHKRPHSTYTTIN